MINYRQKIIKRIFDIVLSSVGLVLVAIPMLILSIAIMIFSKGPIFFTQSRVGLNGKIFKCIKFRTMYIDSEKYGTITTKRDSRITPIGKIMRRYKLDELPQLFNVLIGDMSFVGPRPDVVGYADTLKEDDKIILSIRPGITGPATLKYANEEYILSKEMDPIKYNDEVIYPDKVNINKHYIYNYKFSKDVMYILWTLFPKLFHK